MSEYLYSRVRTRQHSTGSISVVPPRTVIDYENNIEIEFWVRVYHYGRCFLGYLSHPEVIIFRNEVKLYHRLQYPTVVAQKYHWEVGNERKLKFTSTYIFMSKSFLNSAQFILGI